MAIIKGKILIKKELSLLFLNLIFAINNFKNNRKMNAFFINYLFIELYKLTPAILFRILNL